MTHALFAAALLWLQAAPAPSSLPSSFASLVQRLEPVVVAIQTTQAVRRNTERDPFEFFHRFFGAPDDDDRGVGRRSLGSGFIISADGHVVTNYHVVKGASDVAVKLGDGREFKAEVIGRDPKTDLALIKLRGAPSGLPVAQLGDSDKLKVGDWVVAIG